MRDDKGKFIVGNDGKPKGAKNKTPVEIREGLSLALSPHVEKLPEYLEGLEVRERVKLIAQLLPFILPKLQTVTVDNVEERGLPQIIILPPNNSKPPVYNESDVIDPLE